MSEIALKVNRRNTDESSAKQLRKDGKVPGVFYIKDEQPISIFSDPLSLRPIVYTSQTRVINLEIEGDDDPRQCVLKDVNFHPLTDQIIHFDLLGIKKGQKLTVEVPIILKGQAPGLKDGGILQQILHKIKIRVLPKDLIESIEVDISALNIGDSINMGEITLENIECDVPETSVIVTVTRPRLLSAEEESAEAGGILAEGEDDKESASESEE